MSVPNLVPIGPALWHLSHIFEFVTPNPLQVPLGARGVNLFSRCPFADESAYVCQLWSRLVQRFGSFHRFVLLLPPKPPIMPSGLSYVYLEMVQVGTICRSIQICVPNLVMINGRKMERFVPCSIRCHRLRQQCVDIPKNYQRCVIRHEVIQTGTTTM